MQTKLQTTLTSALLAALLPLSASAADLFQVTIASPGGNVVVGDSNVLDLVDKLINTTDEFASYDGQSFVASLRFLGIDNAITFNANNDESGTIHFNLINEAHNYANENDLEEYLKTNGADIYARFLKAVAKQSAVAITDGNPNAATAQSARSDFANFGVTSVNELDFADGEEGGGSGLGGFGLGFNSGTFEADVGAAGGPKTTFAGTFAELGFAWLNVGLGKRVRLVTPLSASYMTIEDTAVYGLNQSIALPIRFMQMNKIDRLNWRLTPTAGANIRVSPDALSGAALWNAGLVNALDYRINRKLILCLMNQISMYESIPVSYDGYSFDGEISQVITKNGLRAVTPLTKRLVGDVFVFHTQFLEDAAVENFLTLGASLSLRATKKFNLTLGGNYDTGEDFNSYSVGLSSAWRW